MKKLILALRYWLDKQWVFKVCEDPIGNYNLRQLFTRKMIAIDQSIRNLVTPGSYVVVSTTPFDDAVQWTMNIWGDYESPTGQRIWICWRWRWKLSRGASSDVLFIKIIGGTK